MVFLPVAIMFMEVSNMQDMFFKAMFPESVYGMVKYYMDGMV